MQGPSLFDFFFFALVNIALDGKKLWPLSDSDKVPRKKGVTFYNNMIHGVVLKNKSFIFIYFISFFF